MKSTTFSALALVLMLPLAACGQAPQSSAPSNATTASKDSVAKVSASGISGEIQKGIEEAKQELATKNIDVNSVHINNDRHDDDSRPKAEITPAGDLLIAGKKVNATPDQHVMLVDYRAQLTGIAEAGMDIGAQGADLGLNAAKEALWGKFTGKSDDEIEASIKPQTDKIKSAALTLCKRLPGLLSSQQKLAAAMPEFKPYATMEQKDIDDCGKEMTDKDGHIGNAVFSF